VRSAFALRQGAEGDLVRLYEHLLDRAETLEGLDVADEAVKVIRQAALKSAALGADNSGMTSPLPLHPFSSSAGVRAALGMGLSMGLSAALITGTAQAQAATPAPLATVSSVDLDRYMGRWYEIARFPNRFQKDCSGPATADYALQPGGRVQVTNRCPQADGKTDEALGEARRVGGAGSPKLEVRFAPAWLSWLPMVWGNYWVIDLDPAYTLAVVSEPKREYLWVLARQAQVDTATWDALMARLRAQGFDLSKLQKAGGGSLP